MYRYFILFIVVLGLYSCSAKKKSLVNRVGYDYDIQEVSIIANLDTIQVNELRFYEINSALDTKLMMFQNFGRWDKLGNGKYQENIKQAIWEGVDLLDDGATFNVIADGTETKTSYFAGLIVFDGKGNDCLESNSLYKEQILELFELKMKDLEIERGVYQLLNN